MPVANYLEHGSELKVKVDLAYPLNAVNSVEPTATKQEDEVSLGLFISWKYSPFHLSFPGFTVVSPTSCSLTSEVVSRTCWVTSPTAFA